VSNVLQLGLRWAPRALAVAFALFLSVFAFTVFGEHRSFPDMAVGFLMQLIPAGLVLAALALAWRFETPGGLLFLGLAGWYIAMTVHKPISWSLVIAGPAILIGALFLASGLLRKIGPTVGIAG
jgi:hypothetical protein